MKFFEATYLRQKLSLKTQVCTFSTEGMPVLNYFVFQVQILAYLDNVFDVHALMEDSELKTVALERVGDLEEELGHVSTNCGLN
jgi:hypothetical protein